MPWQTASFRHRAIEQRPRLRKETQAHVNRAHGVHQRGLNGRLRRQFTLDANRALVEHLARGHRAAARFAGIEDPKEIDEEPGRLFGGACLRLGAQGLALRGGPLHQGVGGESAGEHHAGRGGAGKGEQARIAALLLAAPQRVVSDTEQSGDQFEFGVVLAVLAGTRIGCDRFGARGA